MEGIMVAIMEGIMVGIQNLWIYNSIPPNITSFTKR